MAAIVLAAAATSAASSLGAGVFAAGLAGGVGGMLGGFIDSRLFATHTNQQGPRLTDLMVQVSTYGTLIPILYGQARIGGNVIWALPLQDLAGKADVLVALDDLQTNLPNNQWVSVVVDWFADSATPASLNIKPAVEFDGTGAAVSPDEWSVDGFTRLTAHQILTFGDGSPTFGGTPTDSSIIRLCQELKNRGYKVIFYPQLQVDTITPESKPWRGHITPTSSSDVTAFFTGTYGYNNFVTHYANLSVGGVTLKSVIDAFMLGSELVGLTNYMSSSGVFPAVTQLVSLAATVKTAVGSGVKVTYGADWSEYHSVNGWYHLDALWSSSNIDVVGIDCYFPLTPDLPQDQIDYNAVYNGWTSGEGWDYYWDGTRTIKTNYTAPTFAWKNVKNWWTTTHVNPDSSTTAWTARMKPLWFCAKTGLDSTLIDVTRLTDTIDGYAVTSRQTVRSCLEELASVFFFDMIETDGVLTFVPRGGVSATTIDISQLIPKDKSGSDALTVTRMQELDLPREVDIVYLSRTQDYQSGTQVSQRQTTNAVDYTTLSVNIVFTDEDAKNVADVALYTAWANRTQFSFTLPPQYAQLEPTDIIEITNGGITYAMRITQTKLMRNGQQDVTAVSEDVSAYQFYTAPGQNQNVSSVPVAIASTMLALLDLPAFPTDAVTDSYLRYFAAGLAASWSGVAVYRSDDGGANYNLMQSVATEATIGSVLNNVPAGSFATWDNSTTINVLLIFGQLQSTTDLAVLNGANVCVVGNEVIQFVNATLTGSNQYTLSRLLRGRLGTEWAIGTHTAGETFVLLDNTMQEQAMAASTYGISKAYKPVTIGNTLANTAEQDFTYNANALKPYSPVQIAGARDGSGNLTLTWLRRTRIGGDWLDGVDVPLSEESEKYEIDIMSGSTVKRTITGLTSPTASYTAANQVTDFGSAQSSITANIYQLSAKVGRGYAGNATV